MEDTKINNELNVDTSRFFPIVIEAADRLQDGSGLSEKIEGHSKPASEMLSLLANSELPDQERQDLSAQIIQDKGIMAKLAEELKNLKP